MKWLLENKWNGIRRIPDLLAMLTLSSNFKAETPDTVATNVLVLMASGLQKQ